MYYTRIRWGNPQYEVLFPLKTDSVQTAKHRRDKIAFTSLKGEIMSAYEKYGAEGTKKIKEGLDWQRKGGTIVTTHHLFDDAVNRYKHYLIGQRISEKTIDLYVGDLNKFSRLTHIKYIERIQPRHFSLLKNKLVELSPHTVNRHLRCLQTFLNWLYDEGLTQQSYKIKKLYTISTPVNYYSTSDFKKILENVKKGFPHKEAKMNDDDVQLFVDAFRLYHDTGLRLSEPFNNDLVMDDDGFRLKIIKGSSTKNSYQRFVQLTEFQATTIIRMNEWVDEQLRRGRKHREYTIKVFSRVFKKALIRSEINGKFHDLRKTFASRLYFLTGQEFTLCYALGHTDPKMTHQYVNLDKIELTRAFPDILSMKNNQKMPENDAKGYKKGDIELYSNFGFMI